MHGWVYSFFLKKGLLRHKVTVLVVIIVTSYFPHILSRIITKYIWQLTLKGRTYALECIFFLKKGLLCHKVNVLVVIIVTSYFPHILSRIITKCMWQLTLKGRTYALECIFFSQKWLLCHRLSALVVFVLPLRKHEAFCASCVSETMLFCDTHIL